MRKDINVLIVDDEEIMRSLFTDILEDRGYRVTTVNNGREAQEKVKDTFFHIAFIDVHMPIMNGIATMRKVREISPNTAIIMMDSFPDILLQESQTEGMVACIHKPFDIKEVMRVIDEAIEPKDSILEG